MLTIPNLTQPNSEAFFPLPNPAGHVSFSFMKVQIQIGRTGVLHEPFHWANWYWANLIFFDTNSKKLKNLGFLGEIFKPKSKPKMADLTRATKN